jgi:hypothetical protein
MRNRANRRGSRIVATAALALAAVAFMPGCRRGDTGALPPRSSTPPQAAGPALDVREVESPAGADSREPELFATQDGRVILSWVEKIGEKRYALRFAARDGAGWSEARTAAEGDNWFVNWADFPSVIALGDGSLAAHWLVKSGPGVYAYNVNVARSKDAGTTWGKPVIPHTDHTQTEHGFVSLIPLPDGRVGAVWLDGRNLKDVKEEEEEKGPLPVSMTLRYAAVDAEGRLYDEAQLDERVCECCQTSAALTSEGPVAVYRDRSEAEVRDIYIVRRQGDAWSAPRPVYADNWQIQGCPVNGPSVAADGRRVVVAWFTGAGDASRVKVAFSDDAGATFGSPVQVEDGDATGRVDVLLMPDGSALVCWMSGTAEGGAIKARRVRPDGALGPVSVVAKTDVSRSSGFPRMARAGEDIYFAWTEFAKPTRVRTATTSSPTGIWER